MFHRVGHENKLALDSSILEGFREYTTRRTNKRLPLFVFLVARLFADQHNAGSRRTLAGHNLCRMLVERTPFAFLLGATQCDQRFDGQLTHESLRRGNDLGANPVPAEVCSGSKADLTENRHNSTRAAV
jgi:hypothetical protein